MLKYLAFVLITLQLIACKKNMETSENVMDKFIEFKNKEKFIEDSTIQYPGIAHAYLQPILTAKINQAADDFMEIALTDNPTDQKYQEKIHIGLSRFSDVYLELDTEDQERICEYFEELMDIVGLESSDGQLNEFMYGFDPTKFSF